jgi:hypothetical protein
VHDDDITVTAHTVNGSDHLTEEQARAYLDGQGYAAETEAMIADALRFPETYRYTAGRHRYLVHVLPRDGEWCWLAGDCERSEERIKALGRERRHG